MGIPNTTKFLHLCFAVYQSSDLDVPSAYWDIPGIWSLTAKRRKIDVALWLTLVVPSAQRTDCLFYDADPFIIFDSDRIIRLHWPTARTLPPSPLLSEDRPTLREISADRVLCEARRKLLSVAPIELCNVMWMIISKNLYASHLSVKETGLVTEALLSRSKELRETEAPINYEEQGLMTVTNTNCLSTI